MNILRNKKLLIASITIIVIIIVLIKILFFPSTNRQIKKILKNSGFVLQDNVYIRQSSELNEDEYYDNIEDGINSYNETMYFDINTYEFKKVNLEYYNGMTITLSLNFNYEDEYLTYNYEANENNKGLFFEGYYVVLGGAFGCNFINSNKDSITSEDKKAICNTIEKEVNHFYDESQELFANTNIAEKLSKMLD
ncbi:MAG: hypothetical protein IKF19_06025 [Bacilli bacterium]|nr:hypothetical protein [Bacilli bacterium]